MTLQVTLDLMLCFRQEAQVPLVAEFASDEAERKRSRIPQRIEHAQSATQFRDAVFAPGEMVGLLARGLVERAAQAVGSERLPLIQRLFANFAAVVDSHERGRMAALGFAQIAVPVVDNAKSIVGVEEALIAHNGFARPPVGIVQLPVCQ